MSSDKTKRVVWRGKGSFTVVDPHAPAPKEREKPKATAIDELRLWAMQELVTAGGQLSPEQRKEIRAALETLEAMADRERSGRAVGRAVSQKTRNAVKIMDDLMSKFGISQKEAAAATLRAGATEKDMQTLLRAFRKAKQPKKPECFRASDGSTMIRAETWAIPGDWIAEAEARALLYQRASVKRATGNK